MKKFGLIGIIVFMFIWSFCLAAESVFVDIQGTKYEESVLKLYQKGIISGFEDNTYRPENAVNRAQITKMLVEGLGINSKTEKNLNFSDLSKSHWSYNYVGTAVENKIVVGYDDGTFKPDKEVTFTEIITMMLRKMDCDDELKNISWPDGYLLLAIDKGLFKNVNIGGTNFNVPANRGETAIILNNFISYLEKNNTIKEAQGKENSKEKIELDLSKNWDGEYVCIVDGYMTLKISEDNGTSFKFYFLGYKDGSVKGIRNTAIRNGNTATFEQELFENKIKLSFTRTKEGISIKVDSTNDKYKAVEGLYIIDNGNLNQIEYTNPQRIDSKYKLGNAIISLTENANNTMTFYYNKTDKDGIKTINNTLDFKDGVASKIEYDWDDNKELTITIIIKDNEIIVDSWASEDSIYKSYNSISGVYKFESKNTPPTVVEMKSKLKGYSIGEGVLMGF